MKLRVDRITNQRGATATLLRTSWREGKRVRRKTVANLALMEPEIVDGLEILLNGGVAFDPARGSKGISILRALPHGHAAAALGTARAVGLERILHRRLGRERSLALAATVARITAPDSKLATARRLSPETADSSLGAKLKAATRRTADGLPVHSFTTLLDDLSTLTLNTVKVTGRTDITFEASAKPTRVQKRALELLGVDASVAGGVARGMQTQIQVRSGEEPEKPQRFQCLAAVRGRRTPVNFRLA